MPIYRPMVTPSWLTQKGNPPKRIPLVTHRSDESGRVSLAGCSPAEPASVSSTLSGYQSFYVQSVSDPPAGPRVFVAVHGGFGSQYTSPSVSRPAGLPLTQSSWTASARRCSRKWMSGHAAKALVLLSDRGQPKTKNLCSLGEPTPPGQRESPFPLDHYLSWMTIKFPCQGTHSLHPRRTYTARRCRYVIPPPTGNCRYRSGF